MCTGFYSITIYFKYNPAQALLHPGFYKSFGDSNYTFVEIIGGIYWV